jgi:hypothetical protein
VTDAQRDDRDLRRTVVAVAAAVAFGALLVLAARPLAIDLLARLIPWRGEISSSGTNYRRYDLVAPTVVRRTGAAIMAAGALAIVAHCVAARAPHTDREDPRWFRLGGPGVVVVATGCWYGWLAHPHNAYPSNARYHWVDYLTWDSDNYFYAAGRIPHLLFYDAPFLWQAINVMILASLLWAFARRLELSTAATIMLTATPAIASNLLLFADTSEDVLLNTTLLIGTMLAAASRRPIVLGVMLGLAVLGRPSFGVLFAAVPAAEYLWAVRRDRHLVVALRRTDWRYVGLCLATAVGFTVVAQSAFTMLGRRYLLTDGRLVALGALERQEAIEVDGFLISAFSGTFALHALWAMPAVLLVGSVLGVVRASRYTGSDEPAVYFVAVGGVLVLVLHESQPLNYYNLRYLTYLWPFLLVLSWYAFARMATATGAALRVGVLSMLVMGLMVLPVDPIGVKRRVQDRAETELMAVRSKVERVGEGRPVAVTFGSRSTRNLMAYVLRTNRANIDLRTSEFEPGSLVVSLRGEPAFERSPDFETDSILMWIATPSDVEQPTG